jgi:hypothetical protein
MRGEKNYWELTVHHFATVFAIFYSYACNLEHYGPFILIASDISDAFLNIAKLYRDLYEFKGVKADIMFGVVMGTWFITRNIFLTGCWHSGIYKLLPFKKVVLQDEKYRELW